MRYKLNTSGAGTNLSGGIGPAQNFGARIRHLDTHSPPNCLEKNLLVPLHCFCFKSTIICFGERFRDGQYCLVSFLFAVLLLTVPP